MPRDDLAMYTEALGELLRCCRWTERRIAREILCAMDLTGEQADAVIDDALERGTLIALGDELVPR